MPATRPQPDVPRFHILPEHKLLLEKSGDRHKYDYGHAVFVSGPAGKGGAARMAARGALRVGAGLVTLLSPGEAQAEHAAQLNAIMLKTYPEAPDFGAALTDLKPSAIGIGPNIGLSDESMDKLSRALSVPCPLCLDADAITLLARAPNTMRAWAHSEIVMTPHEGELRRLIPEAFDETSCRMTLARAAASKLNCIVLFKGRQTIIAAPDGHATMLDAEDYLYSAWLATAGSGDVLCGIITGLLARGLPAFEAASLGTALHLKCAEIAGPGLIAEDLPEALPKVLGTL